MPSLAVPTDIKTLDSFLQNEASTVQLAIQEALPKSLDKFYMARLLDLYIKKINKQIKQHDLLIETMFPGVGAAELDKKWGAFARAENSFIQINELLTTASSPDQFIVAPEGIDLVSQLEEKATTALQIKKTLERKLTAAQLARKALSLSPNEEARVYRNIESVYAEQVRNRKWYHHGGVAVFLSIIILPISPLIYYLWKKQRNTENIQPNKHTLTDKRISRISRQHFKEHVNTVRERSFTTLKPLAGYDAPPPKFLTKHKKARNEFFRKHYEWRLGGTSMTSVENNDIDWVLNSKEEDENLRLSLGIK
ncbi:MULTISPECIES: hypothetical protein [unclassified Legionella]|uniref:hypothetical protein n=1 Tax=unclassified Legionella TaxID=2622702 RepID=UPI001054493E|nr:MULTISPECIES: hypothetical protein [unclassified Legionella]MDI9819023.1 hypothetical protein [Legionella sp. PL877]